MAGVVRLSLYFLLLIYVVTAQRETTTKGNSGPACGKTRRCLKEATCDRRKRLCMCPKGYRGNGNMGCVKEENLAIFLQGDPNLNNLYSELLPLQTPCPYRLVKYTTPDSNRVEVYAQNDLYFGGKYYAKSVEVRFFIKRQEAFQTYSILIEGLAENGVYKFQEWRKSENDVFWKTPVDDIETVGSFKIVTTYDTVNNQAHIDAADGFGLKVLFRPAEVTTEYQSQIPGIVVDISDSIKLQIHFSENELSSTPEGPSVVETAAKNKVSLSNWVIYTTMNNIKRVEPEGSTCDKMYNDFKHECNSRLTRLASVKACSALYTDEPFLKCLATNKISTVSLARLYRECQTALCTNRYMKCIHIETKIRDEFNCPVPKGLSYCSSFFSN
ncbi:uncharacterized protein LOC106075022 [Biomphalaria glabrata]|uniref:Uncharacterized protein LOC106075022 n=1 Tax=Biomphalaria glabrata TaxID=6526 RepID=A0A9W2ZBH3_BIOGL|nr:uncharacterized protein LOC106075022 [Biomphalaria glabrata]